VYVPETRPDTVVVWEVIVIPKVPVLTVTFAVSKNSNAFVNRSHGEGSNSKRATEMRKQRKNLKKMRRLKG